MTTPPPAPPQRLLATWLVLAAGIPASSAQEGTVPPANPALPGGAGAWELVFAEEFSDPVEALADRWEVHHGPSPHTLTSRWRENLTVEDGRLRIHNRRESRGGQDWTSGSMRTRRTFTGGYFECRYRYADAPATNNSFWLMTARGAQGPARQFEIDINEGHVPGEIRTNIHDWGTPHRWFERRVVLGKRETAALGAADLGRNLHVYGLEWNDKELVWWFDGREIRRLQNEFCHGPAHLYLSCAILQPEAKSAERVTAAIDGTSMDVDWVRVFRRREVDGARP